MYVYISQSFTWMYCVSSSASMPGDVATLSPTSLEMGLLGSEYLAWKCARSDGL